MKTQHRFILGATLALARKVEGVASVGNEMSIKK